MRRYVYDDPRRVCKWVGDRIAGEDFGEDAVAIGVEDDGELVGGVVYTHYCGTDIRMHTAGVGRWLSRQGLFRFYAYPFIQLGCRRVTGLVRADNPTAQRFNEKLGYVKEGVLRDADDDGCDLIVYGMTKAECRWIENKKNKDSQHGKEVV